MKFLESFRDNPDGAVKHLQAHAAELRELVVWAIKQLPATVAMKAALTTTGPTWVDSVREVEMPIGNTGERKAMGTLTGPEVIKIGGYLKRMGSTVVKNGETITAIGERIPKGKVLNDIWGTLTKVELRTLTVWALRYAPELMEAAAS